MKSSLPWTKLPFTFDPAGLRADLQAIPEAAWQLHFNRNDYAGEWSSLSLRSRSGRSDDILPAGDPADFRDTPLMASCPHLQAAIEAFRFPLKSVRLMRLHPGSRIKEHKDHDLGLEHGELRIHIPVATSQHVEFIVANRVLPLAEGEAWYIDFSQPHRIRNLGPTHRVHLVLDGTVNPWATAMLQNAAQHVATTTLQPRGMAELERFRQHVFDDPALQAELLQARSTHDLIEATVAAGAQRGFLLDPEDAQSALHQQRQDWMARTSQPWT